MNIPFLKYQKIYYLFSIALVLGSLTSLLVFGLKLGIDFTGTNVIELEFKDKAPEKAVIEKDLADLKLGTITFQSIGEKGVLVRLKSIDEKTHQGILARLKDAEEQRFETIEPLVNRELGLETKITLILSALAAVSYIVFAFRKISYPLKSWQFGAAALVSLFFDFLILFGFFSILGKFYQMEINIPLITAILVVFGYSISESIVVFDRIRENLLRREKNLSFEEIVNNSLNRTVVRLITTGVGALLILLAIFFFGGESLKYFSLVLIMGIATEIYSSIFIAGPFIVALVKWKNKELTRTSKGV